MPADWSAAPCGLLTLRLDGTVLAANPTFQRWTGRSEQDLLGGVRLPELLSVGGRIYWETHLFPLLQVEGRVDEVSLELVGKGGRVPVLVSAVVTGAQGDEPRVEVALSSARERQRFEGELVAARRTAERNAHRVRALQEATAALSGAPGVRAVADALTTTVATSLGARGARVWLDHPGLTAADQGPAPEVDGPDAVQGADGAVVVPLPGRTGVRGVLRLIPDDAPGADPIDLEVMTAIGRQAGVALDRAALYEESSRLAHELQHSLLAVPPQQDARYGVEAVYRPGVEGLDVGGDWHDAFCPQPGVIAVVVGDVVGRGLGAAIAMGQLRSAVRAVAGPGVGPAAVLSGLDRFVEQVPGADCATLAYAELDLASGLLTYACAGHPPPLLVPLGQQPRFLWEGRSTPLGVEPPVGSREEGQQQLAPLDRVLLYTDGLVERRASRIDERLDLLLAVTDELGRGTLVEAVGCVTEALLRDEQGRDDVCVLLLGWEARAAAETGLSA